MDKEVYKNIDLVVPEPKKSLWVVRNINLLEVFDDEKGALVYIKGYLQSINEYENEKEKMLSECDDHLYHFLAQRMNISKPKLFRYDFLEQYQDKHEVFIINKLDFNDLETEIISRKFKTNSDLNDKMISYSNDGVNWQLCYGNLGEEYSIFEKKGIFFQKRKNYVKKQ